MTTALNLKNAVEAALSSNTRALDLPRKQQEGLAYQLLRTRFQPFFEGAVKQLMACPQSELKTVIGRLVDYRTRLLASALKVPEEKLQALRYSFMNVLRDEAFMRSRPESTERFCSVHTAKGRTDEGMPGIRAAFAEISEICGSFTPITAESRYDNAEATLYENDERLLIDPMCATETQDLLRQARIGVNFGQSVPEQLRGWQDALDALVKHSNFTRTPGGFMPHLDRLLTARYLRTQLHRARQERVSAHEYSIRGDRVSVPAISRAAAPLPAVTIYVVTRGWTVLDSGMIDATDHATLELNLKAQFGEDIQVFSR